MLYLKKIIKKNEKGREKLKCSFWKCCYKRENKKKRWRGRRKKKKEERWGRRLDTRSSVIPEFLSDVWKKSYTSGILSKIFSVTIATGVNFLMHFAVISTAGKLITVWKLLVITSKQGSTNAMSSFACVCILLHLQESSRDRCVASGKSCLIIFTIFLHNYVIEYLLFDRNSFHVCVHKCLCAYVHAKDLEAVFVLDITAGTWGKYMLASWARASIGFILKKLKCIQKPEAVLTNEIPVEKKGCYSKGISSSYTQREFQEAWRALFMCNLRGLKKLKMQMDFCCCLGFLKC